MHKITSVRLDIALYACKAALISDSYLDVSWRRRSEGVMCSTAPP